MASSSSNVVGVHYRVGKKIGEGSFGVIFEGTNLLNNTQVAIKFVSPPFFVPAADVSAAIMLHCLWNNRYGFTDFCDLGTKEE